MKKLFFIFCLLTLINCQQKTGKEGDSTEQNVPEVNAKIEPMNLEYINQIIPGKRLGNIVIEEISKAIFDSLGKPDMGDAAMGKTLSSWNVNSKDLLSIFTATKMGVEDFSRIKAIRTLSPKFMTKKKIGVNSSLAEIEKNFHLKKLGIFQSNGKNYTLYSSDDGIGFEIDERQKCHGIVIMKSGTNPDQHYLSFYPDLVKNESEIQLK